MNTIAEIEKKIEYYEMLERKAEKAYANAHVEGNLRVAINHGVPQYYLVTKSGDTKGKYIKNKDRSIAHKIAQRDYNKKVADCANQWKKYYQKLLKELPQEQIKDIDMKRVGRRRIITPYELSDEEYRYQWQNVQFTGKKFLDGYPEIYTEKGEHVRSKSEKMIADKLFMMGIPYRYEYPLVLKGFGTVYPDFTLLHMKDRKEYILEHFGMMDNAEYSAKAVDKIAQYQKNGIYPGETLLMTFETSDKPLDMKLLQRMLERIW